MPRDKRLYMTFPNDFWLHPKVAILSDSAFRAFVEINGYSRMQDLDGAVPVTAAKKQWKPKALHELESNHSERPSLTITGSDYIIRDYAEHQETRESIAARQERNQVNGAKGGRPRKDNPTETQSVIKTKPRANPNETQTKAESESESDIETDVTKDYESSQVSDGSDSGLDSIILRAKRVGINDLQSARTNLAKASGEPVTMHGALILAEAIASKSARDIRNVDAYIATVCRKSTAEVQQAYFDLDIGAYP